MKLHESDNMTDFHPTPPQSSDTATADHSRPANIQVRRPPAEDEIDLVELGVGLWRKRRTILATILVCVTAGLAVALLKPKEYVYSTLIQLGTYPDDRGTLLQVMSAEAALSTLNTAIVPTLVSQHARQQYIDPKTFKIAASNSGGGNQGGGGSMVTLAGQGPLKDQAVFFAIETQAAKQLAQITAGRSNAAVGNITAQLDQAKIEMHTLQDPTQIQSEKAVLLETMLAAQGNLANLKQQVGVLKQKLASLDKTETLDQGLVSKLEEYLGKTQQASLQAIDANSATQAMTALLLNNQMQQNMQQLNSIQQKLTLELPQELADTQAALASNLNQQKVQQQALSRANFALENYGTQHARKVQKQQTVIARLGAQLQALTPTRVVAEPTRSAEPVGIGRGVLVVFSGFFGVFLGLFFALMGGYVQEVRARLRAQADVSTMPNALKSDKWASPDRDAGRVEVSLQSGAVARIESNDIKSRSSV